jgi:hypothetical protein
LKGKPENFEAFALKIDEAMRRQNVYYDDLIAGNVLRALVITKVPKKRFSGIHEIHWQTGWSKQAATLSKRQKNC